MKSYIVRCSNWKYKVSLDEEYQSPFIEAATRAVSDIFGEHYLVYPTTNNQPPSIGFFISICEEKYINTDDELTKEYFCSSEIAFANAGLHELSKYIEKSIQELKSQRV